MLFQSKNKFQFQPTFHRYFRGHTIIRIPKHACVDSAISYYFYMPVCVCYIKLQCDSFFSSILLLDFRFSEL